MLFETICNFKAKISLTITLNQKHFHFHKIHFTSKRQNIKDKNGYNTHIDVYKRGDWSQVAGCAKWGEPPQV